MKKLLIHCKRCAVLLLALTAVSLNSCTDYDDDISDLQSQIDKNSDDIETNAGNIASNAALIAANSSTISSLQSDLAALTSTVGALELGDQVEVTTDGTDMTVTVNGVDYTIYGTICETPTLSISEETGNWVLSGVDTGYPAITELVDPVLTVVDGNWYLNGTDTGFPAVLEDTNTTEDSTLEISETTGNWVLDGVDTGFPAIIVDTNTTEKSTLEVGANGNWFIDGVDTEIPAITEITEPVLSIIDGNWAINGVDQGIPAITVDNDTVCDCPGLTVGANGNWYINGVDTTYPSVYEEATLVVGENGNWFLNGVDQNVPAITEVPVVDYAQVWSVNEETGFWQYEVNGETYQTEIAYVVDTDTDTNNDTDTTYEYSVGLSEDGYSVVLTVTATTTDVLTGEVIGESVVETFTTGVSSNAVSAFIADDGSKFELSVNGEIYTLDLTSTVPLKTLAFVPDQVDNGLGAIVPYTIYGYEETIAAMIVDPLNPLESYDDTSDVNFVQHYVYEIMSNAKGVNEKMQYLGSGQEDLSYRTSCEITNVIGDYAWEFLTRDVVISRAADDVDKPESIELISKAADADGDAIICTIAFSSVARFSYAQELLYVDGNYEAGKSDYVLNEDMFSAAAGADESVIALSATPGEGIADDYNEDIVSDYQTVHAIAVPDLAIYNVEDVTYAQYSALAAKSRYPEFYLYADRTTYYDYITTPSAYKTYYKNTVTAAGGLTVSAVDYYAKEDNRVKINYNSQAALDGSSAQVIDLKTIVSLYSQDGVLSVGSDADDDIRVKSGAITWEFSIDAVTPHAGFAGYTPAGTDDDMTEQNKFVTLTDSNLAINVAKYGSSAIGRYPVVYACAYYKNMILAEAYIPIVIVDEVDPATVMENFKYVASTFDLVYSKLPDYTNAVDAADPLDYQYTDVTGNDEMNINVYKAITDGGHTNNIAFSQEIFDTYYSVAEINDLTVLPLVNPDPTYVDPYYETIKTDITAILPNTFYMSDGREQLWDSSDPDGFWRVSFAYGKNDMLGRDVTTNLTDNLKNYQRGIHILAAVTPDGAVTNSETAQILFAVNDQAFLGLYTFEVVYELKDTQYVYDETDLPQTITVQFSINITEDPTDLEYEYLTTNTLTDSYYDAYGTNWGKQVEDIFDQPSINTYKMQQSIDELFADKRLMKGTYDSELALSNYAALAFAIVDEMPEKETDAENRFRVFDNSKAISTQAITCKNLRNTYAQQELGLIPGEFMTADDYTVGLRTLYKLDNSEAILDQAFQVVFKNPFVVSVGDVVLEHTTLTGKNYDEEYGYVTVTTIKPTINETTPWTVFDYSYFVSKNNVTYYGYEFTDATHTTDYEPVFEYDADDFVVDFDPTTYEVKPNPDGSTSDLSAQLTLSTVLVDNIELTDPTDPDAGGKVLSTSTNEILQARWVYHAAEYLYDIEATSKATVQIADEFLFDDVDVTIKILKNVE